MARLKKSLRKSFATSYVELEYIEATGTQYLDTGIKLNSDDVVKTEFANTSSTGYGAVYGIYQTGESSAFYANQTYYGYDVVNKKVNTNISVDTEWHETTHDFSNGILTIDNTTVSFTPFEFENTVNNYLFGRYYDGSYGYLFKGRIRKFKVIRNGVVICDLIPAKNGSDVVGMYDRISKTFLTNVGEGDFIPGEPVPPRPETNTTSIYGVNDDGEACMRVDTIATGDDISIYGTNEYGEACVRVAEEADGDDTSIYGVNSDGKACMRIAEEVDGDDTSIYGVNGDGKACVRVSTDVTSSDPSNVYGVNGDGKACVRIISV